MKKLPLARFAALIAGLCAAFSGPVFAQTGEITVLSDVPYLAPDRTEKLDIYLPPGADDAKSPTRFPGIVLIHGGGWTGGSKSAAREKEEGPVLARAGYVCVSIDYRLTAQNRWPTNIYDGKNAVRFLRANAAKYHVDPDRIGVIGGSAGGHLALMVGYTTGNSKLTPTGANTPYPGISDKVSAVVDMYGITNVQTSVQIAKDGTPLTAPKPWDAVFGDHKPVTDADRILVSPVSHIGPQTPPTLVLHGTIDTIVDRDQSIELDKKLTDAGVPHQFLLIPGIGHTFDFENWNKKPLPQDLRPVVIGFLDKYLKPGKADAPAAKEAETASLSLAALFGDNMVLQRNAPVPVWGTAAPGETITVLLGTQKSTAKAGGDGNWQITLAALPAGGPYPLTVSSDAGQKVTRTGVLLGDVWLCSGQSNMEFALRRDDNFQKAAAADPNLRFFKVAYAYPNAPASDVKGAWKPCDAESAGAFSAVAFYFARALRRANPGIPIGIIGAYVGGTPAQGWIREAALSASTDLKTRYIDTYPKAQAEHDAAMQKYEAALADAKTTGKKEPQKPYSFWHYSALYNGMISPLTRFPLRGVVWYQGESNAKDPDGYKTLLPVLISDWRAQWHAEVPFLLVQLPPFGSPAGDKQAWAEIREIQSQTAQKLTNVSYVVTTDVGAEHNIHPTSKEPVGERLALAARSAVYKEPNLAAFGPTFQAVTLQGNRALVTFDNAGDGLMIKGGTVSGVPVSDTELSGFMVAGLDKKFVPARAEIAGKNTISVSSPAVAAPKFVRYGFVNFPVLNLWNKNGLPAAPFRTDAP